MLDGMNRTGLSARIGYAVTALVVTGAIGFSTSMWLLPAIAARFPGADTDADGYGFFTTAIAIGLGLGFTFGLIGLTLPWKRRRRRTGRAGRIAVSTATVVIASVIFATEGHALAYDLMFAAWLSYVFAFTYVRYGILDRPHKRESAGADAERTTKLAS